MYNAWKSMYYLHIIFAEHFSCLFQVKVNDNLQQCLSPSALESYAVVKLNTN